MQYIGIDPGLSGAAAAVDENGYLEVITFKHHTNHDISTWLSNFTQATAQIELVGPRPEDADRMGSMAKLMKSFGMLTGFLIAHQIQYEDVTPVKWQRTMKIPVRAGKSHAEHKRVLKSHAQRLYPTTKVTLNNADAILLAHYCRLSSVFG